MTQQAMDPADPVEDDLQTSDPVEVDPDPDGALVEVDRPDPETGDDGLQDALVAVPAALLLVGNALTVVGATAFQSGGAAGLMGAAAVTGGSAAAGALVRHAHRAEARRRQEASAETEADKPGKRAGKPLDKPLTRAEQARAVRQAERAARTVTGAGTAGGARPGAGRSLTGGRRAAAGRAGAGARTGRGAGTGQGARRGGGPIAALRSAGLRKQQAGVGKHTGAGKSGAAGGRSGAGVGGAGARRGLGSRAAAALGAGAGRRAGRAGGAGRLGGGGGIGAGRSGAGGGSGAGRGVAGRLARLGQRAGGASAARRVAGSRPVRAGAAGVGAARRAAAAGTARLGRGTHAATGSRPGRMVAGLGRRAGTAGRATAGGLRRSGQAGRAVLAGARAGKGTGVLGMAKAVRGALKSERERQDRETGRRLGRLARFRRWVSAATVTAGAGVLAGSWGLGRGLGRWSGWIVRAIAARRAGLPAPPPPTKAGAREAQRLAEIQQVAATAHPPVADVVDDLPQRLRRQGTSQVSNPRGAQPMSKLGLYLEKMSGEMAAAAAGYDPEGMLEWGADMAMLETVLNNVAAVLEALQKGADDLPIEPVVKSTIGTVAELQHACAEAADEIHTTFQAVHRDELARLENPRPGEHKWDTGSNK